MSWWWNRSVSKFRLAEWTLHVQTAKFHLWKKFLRIRCYNRNVKMLKCVDEWLANQQNVWAVIVKLLYILTYVHLFYGSFKVYIALHYTTDLWLFWMIPFAARLVSRGWQWWIGADQCSPKNFLCKRGFWKCFEWIEVTSQQDKSAFRGISSLDHVFSIPFSAVGDGSEEFSTKCGPLFSRASMKKAVIVEF